MKFHVMQNLKNISFSNASWHENIESPTDEKADRHSESQQASDIWGISEIPMKRHFHAILKNSAIRRKSPKGLCLYFVVVNRIFLNFYLLPNYNIEVQYKAHCIYFYIIHIDISKKVAIQNEVISSKLDKMY